MGDIRNRLDRKNELRLYEWMKNEGNYGKLSDKTVTEGAEVVSNELGLKVSGNVLVSLVQAMGLDPFWKVRIASKKPEQTQDDWMRKSIWVIEAAVRENANKLEEHAAAFGQLKTVCNALVSRIERVEKVQELKGGRRKLDGAATGSVGKMGGSYHARAS